MKRLLIIALLISMAVLTACSGANEPQLSSASEQEKENYRRAYNFGHCRSIYHDAKLLIQDHVGWFARQKRLGQICDHINRKHMQYPNTRYCKLVTLPVRLRLTPVIDAIAWRLTR